MLVPPNRRRRERRQDPRLREPLERKGDRRSEDRRDSSRPFRNLFVESSLAPLPIQHRASISLQGARWVTELPPPEVNITLHLQLPDMATESIIAARIERREELGDGNTELYAAFVGMDVKTELALARFIDNRSHLATELEAEARVQGN